MLYFDLIDISEGIDVKKTSSAKKCIICHCHYSEDKGFKFNWMSLGVMIF